jgi:hypothetical protein
VLLGFGPETPSKGRLATEFGSGMKQRLLPFDVGSPFESAQNPDDSSAQLLLGLEAINTSKNERLPEDERRLAFVSGTKLIELAFKANQKNSAAANALCELFLRKGNHSRVCQLQAH